MEINKVKELVSAFKEAGLTSLSLKCDEFELKLKKEGNAVDTNDIAESQTEGNKAKQEDKKAKESTDASEKIQSINESKSHSCSQSNEKSEEASSRKEAVEEVKPIAGKTINAPMVGTFYSAGAPGAEPFVKVGDHVKKGDVVCVIEAMKLMNEVEAEEDGEIVEILVNNEDMVEYGAPLFVVR